MPKAIQIAAWLLLIAMCGSAALTPREAEEGWILLHDGSSNMGWTSEGGAAWSTLAGSLVCSGANAGYLRANTPFADFQLRLEVKASAQANAGLIVRAAKDGLPRETGFEISLGNGDTAWPAGSIVDRAKASSPLASDTWVPLEVEVNHGRLTVSSQGRTLATAAGVASQSGFLLLDARRGGRVEVRNMRLLPLGLESRFNGTDLAGWKSTGVPAKKASGMISKIFGGGKKAREVKWTVRNGMIHGEDGPGRLELVVPQGDFLLQASVRTQAQRRYAIVVRGDAGVLDTGYEVTVQPKATGALSGLSVPTRQLGSPGQFAMLTVAARGRHFQIWVDGVPVTDVNDPRTEGTDPKKEARLAAGVVAFYSPEDEANLDIRSVKLSAIPTSFGHVAGKANKAQTATAPPPPPPPPPAPPGQPPPTGAERVLQEQIRQQTEEKQREEQKQQQISSLLQQALRTPEPESQVQLYDQILALDPNNQVAFNGRKEAQGKLDQAQDAARKLADAEAAKQVEEEQKQANLASSIQTAEAAFLAGNLSQAESALSAAERIAPQSPQVQAIRQRVDAVRARTNLMYGVGGAGGGLALIGGLVLLLRARGRKDPYLEVIVGLDKGKRYRVDKEVLLIGAIPEDGGIKNDVVLRDAERMVSRFHAQILSKDGKVYVVDTDSANGTFVDKRRIPPRKPQELKSGAHVTLGGTCTVTLGFEKRKK